MGVVLGSMMRSASGLPGNAKEEKPADSGEVGHDASIFSRLHKGSHHKCKQVR